VASLDQATQWIACEGLLHIDFRTCVRVCEFSTSLPSRLGVCAFGDVLVCEPASF
jgi:hypothetical protein